MIDGESSCLCSVTTSRQVGAITLDRPGKLRTIALEQFCPARYLAAWARRVEIMRKVGVSEAKDNLLALLEEVERGGEVTITRRGKAIARLVLPAAVGREAAMAAADRILARSKGVRLGGVDLQELVRDGRR